MVKAASRVQIPPSPYRGGDATFPARRPLSTVRVELGADLVLLASRSITIPALERDLLTEVHVVVMEHSARHANVLFRTQMFRGYDELGLAPSLPTR